MPPCAPRTPLLPLLALVLGAAGPAARTARAQQSDTAYARLIREYTTDPRFLPASAASLPASATVPSPQAYFGTIVGAPGVMHHTGEIYGYFRALAQASPRVKVETLGKTEEGRDIILVLVGNAQDLARIDEYRAAMARLADPRRTPTEADARALEAQIKPFYSLNGGLHSPEMGSPEMLMELAYRLAVGEDPAIKAIRDNLVVLINPTSEPDGRDKQVDWYLHYTKGRPSYDDGFPRVTPYWGRYMVHDNNRDGLQVSGDITRAIFKAYYEYHPLVLHDLHESVPLLYISTGTGPYNEHNDPIIIGEWQTLANNDITTLEAQGLPGVWTWGFFDGWWPGYGAWVANNHNSIGRFFETFGNAGADTYVRDLGKEKFAGEAVTDRTWYRPWPPTKKVRWSARDNINYMEAGVLSSLGFVAASRERFLHDFWQKGYNSLQRGLTQAPHAYVIPGFARQRDPKMVAYLVNQLERQQIEVQRRTSGPDAGDFVILLNQPYRDLAVNLLSLQKFPATAQYPPYDDIAWTLQELYGVEVKPVNDTAAFHWAGLQPLTDTVAATAQPSGSGPVYLLPYRAQAEALSGLYWLRRTAPSARVLQATTSFADGGVAYPAGSLLLEGLSPEQARQLGERFALPLTAVAAAPAVTTHRIDLPRIAVYHSWYDTRPEGWVRYTFEQRGIPYSSIDKDDLRRGALRQRFDVILLPNESGSLEQLMNGVNRKWGPLAYEKTKATPNLGTPASSPDITGGPGFAGMAGLQRFLDEGGVVLSMANATRLVAESGIARELEPHAAPQLFHPGSLVRAKALRPTHPLLYGYPAVTTIYRGNGPLFEVPERDRGMMVLEYGTKPAPRPDTGAMLGMGPAATAAERGSGGAGEREMATASSSGNPTSSAKPAASGSPGSPGAAGASPAPPLAGVEGRGGVPRSAEAADTAYVVSGMVRHPEEIVGQGAIFDVPVGKGRVLAFTFNPLHRFLSHATFPLVWNALMNWDALPGIPSEGPGAPVAAAEQH